MVSRSARSPGVIAAFLMAVYNALIGYRVVNGGFESGRAVSNAPNRPICIRFIMAFSATIPSMNWREHILSDPQILQAKPCVKGTRIPVALILGYLAAGRDAAAIHSLGSHLHI